MYIVLLILTLRSAYIQVKLYHIIHIQITPRNFVKHKNQTTDYQNLRGLFRHIYLPTEANGFILPISSRTEIANMI
jgi:hypothetical protein